MFGFIKGLSKFQTPKIKVGGYQPDPSSLIESGDYWKFSRSEFSFNPYNYGDVDFRPITSPRHNQRTTSTCVAQALVKALEIKRNMKYGKDKHVDLSVLDLYWGARDLMKPKKTNVDMGTFISLGCDVLRRYGVCRSKMHPFDTKKLYIPPSVMASREARLNRIHSHFRLYSTGSERIEDIILNLRAGNPVVFGTKVGTDWMKYRGGSEPLRVERTPKGGHAMTIIGYVDGLFVIENSWGTSWGDDGFALVSPEVFTHKYTRDLWVIVTGSEAWFEKR